MYVNNNTLFRMCCSDVLSSSGAGGLASIPLNMLNTHTYKL